MIRLLFILLSFLTISASLYIDQRPSKTYPQDYFRSPVDHAIKLSGTFGELRPNHFHAGIDIKSKTGKTGQNIYAVADGVVSRINIKSSGYGNALYIDHPNGYTSVYAHLGKFPKEIQEYMKRQQYENQTSEIVHYPPVDTFQFKKGDIIGTLGMSGRSYGPHLHFEIRETKSEIPINPLLFGFSIDDKVRPDLRAIKLYGLDKQMNELESKQYTLRKNGAHYRPSKDTIEMKSYEVGVALKAYDQMTGVSNLNGIYALEMYVDDSLHFQFTMDEISFEETRYINAHMDYPEREVKKSYFNRCFKLPGNKLSIYQENEWHGVVRLSENKATKIKYIVTDLHKNTSESTFWLKRSKQPLDYEGAPYQYILFYDQDNEIVQDDVHIFFPKGALYRNLQLHYMESVDSSHNIYSNVYHVHEFTTPLHKYFEIGIKPNAGLDRQKDKAFVGYCGKDQKYINCGGKWKGDMLRTKTSQLGNFCIMLDTVPPTITPIRFSQNLKTYKSISFKIEDNFEVGKGGEDLSYEGRIDGQWVLMKYNGKLKTITYRFDDKLTTGDHIFTLMVSDALGNTTKFEKPISR